MAMTLSKLKEGLREHLYIEDEDVIDVVMAATLSNIMRLGQPVWLVLIGAPSSGKTQYILPLEHSQPEGKKIIHQITDLTPNTFLSAYNAGKGKEPISMLHRIGEYGIMLFPDLTSLFSKEPQVMQEILGQLRHVYDGYLTKHTGNQEPMEWKGSLGIIAASTASLYDHFSRVADMGERFLYYRLRPFDRDKATNKALNRKLYGKDLDQHIGTLYREYLSSVALQTVSKAGKKGKKEGKPLFTDKDNERLKEIAKFASIIRTPVHTDFKTRHVDRIPEPEMPMRTVLQLRGLALGMMVMNECETGKAALTEKNHRALEWCAFSLADDERRMTLQTLAQYPAGCTAAGLAMVLGLPTHSVGYYLQQLDALKIARRTKGGSTADLWHMKEESDREIVLRLTVAQVQGGVFDDPNATHDFEEL